MHVSDGVRPASSALPRSASAQLVLAPSGIQRPLRLVIAPLQLYAAHHHCVPLLDALGPQLLVDACPKHTLSC